MTYSIVILYLVNCHFRIYCCSREDGSFLFLLPFYAMLSACCLPLYPLGHGQHAQLSYSVSKIYNISFMDTPLGAPYTLYATPLFR